MTCIAANLQLVVVASVICVASGIAWLAWVCVDTIRDAADPEPQPLTAADLADLVDEQTAALERAVAKACAVTPPDEPIRWVCGCDTTSPTARCAGCGRVSCLTHWRHGCDGRRTLRPAVPRVFGRTRVYQAPAEVEQICADAHAAYTAYRTVHRLPWEAS